MFSMNPMQSVFASSVAFAADGVPSGGSPDVNLDPPIVTTPVVKPAVSSEDKDAETWKSRAIGWQKAYNSQKEQLASITGEYDAYKASAGSVTSQRDLLETKFQELFTGKTAVDQELATVKGKHERAELILNEFPELMSFYKGGLLPDGTGEELKTKLTAFQEQLKTISGNASLKKLSGATPPAPNSSGTSDDASDPNSLRKQAFAALSGGNNDEYTRLMNLSYQKQK